MCIRDRLKALVVEGDGSVNVKDPQTVADLSDYMLREIIGSNNNHVVPSTQQEWACLLYTSTPAPTS